MGMIAGVRHCCSLNHQRCTAGSASPYARQVHHCQPDIITLRKQQEFCDALRDYRLEIEIDRKGSITKALASVQLEQRLEPENYLLLIDSLRDQGVQIRETDVGEFQISYQGKFILPNYAYSSRLKEQGAALSGFLPGAF